MKPGLAGMRELVEWPRTRAPGSPRQEMIDSVGIGCVSGVGSWKRRLKMSDDDDGDDDDNES